MFFFLTIASDYFLLAFNSVAFVIFYLRSFFVSILFHQINVGGGRSALCAAIHQSVLSRCKANRGLRAKCIAGRLQVFEIIL
jgi:hypothetical protein